jgi:hypothetical protein
MLRHTLTFAVILALFTAAGAAESAQPAQQAQPAAAKPDTAKPETTKPEAERPASQTTPRDPIQLVNVRIEMTVLDQTGPGEPSRKVVTMLVADRQNASIRTMGWVLTKEGRRDVTINVDARPTVLRGKEGSVQVDLALEYRPAGASSNPGLSLPAAAEAGSSQTGLNERIGAILESGKPMLISQAADPTSDRRISVELKATILK